jgi:hypothetical protein
MVDASGSYAVFLVVLKYPTYNLAPEIGEAYKMPIAFTGFAQTLQRTANRRQSKRFVARDIYHRVCLKAKFRLPEQKWPESHF